MDERALADLRALAERDEDLARQAARLHELDAEVAAIRHRAGAIATFFRMYGAEEAQRRSETAAADAELSQRRDELTSAEEAFGRAPDEVARAHAERSVERARDHVVVAEARVARAKAAETELEGEAAAAQSELPTLDARARAVEGVPAPAGDLDEWASRAHAALFVAAGQLDGQRERVIREANELASMLLGEATFGSTATQALARAEERFAGREGARFRT